MRILGLDPGTATTGWAVVEQVDRSKKALLIECGIITTPALVPLANRLQQLFAETQALMTRLRPDQAAIEALYFAKNRTTALAVGHARGVLLLATSLANLPYGEYSPPQIKQSITGYGNADKRQVQSMLRAHIQADVYPTQDDAADAVAIALTHLAHLKFAT